MSLRHRWLHRVEALNQDDARSQGVYLLVVSEP